MRPIDGAGQEAATVTESYDRMPELGPPTYPPAYGATGYGPSQYDGLGYPQPVVTPKSVQALGTAVQILLGVQFVAGVIALVAAVHSRSIVVQITERPGSVPAADADAADHFVSLMSSLGLALLVATGIVWIVWFFRLRQNVEAWDPQFQRRGQGWTIGGWFCPIVNLWVPFTIAVDVLDDTESTTDLAFRKTRPVLVIWWMSWLIMFATRLVVARFGDSNSLVTPADYRNYATGLVVVAVVNAAAIVPAVFAVRQLTAAQTARIAGRL